MILIDVSAHLEAREWQRQLDEFARRVPVGTPVRDKTGLWEGFLLENYPYREMFETDWLTEEFKMKNRRKNLETPHLHTQICDETEDRFTNARHEDVEYFLDGRWQGYGDVMR